jgi:type VI secretion system protein ImpH
MQNLALPQVINLFATATDTAAGVARLKALGFENLLYFYEYAIRDAGFAGYLELFHFPAIVASIEAEFYSGQPVRNLSRIDLYRLRRLLFAMLGAERLAGGEKSLDARNVLTLRTKGVPLPQPMFKQMEAEPHRFDFFASMRALQVAFSRWPKIGASISLSEDYARMRQEPDMAFAPRTIRSFKFGEPDHPEVPSIISVNFLGLFGPNGPLPLHFTDYVLSRLREGDAALATFADVFQHRSLTFFFRAWAVHQKTVDLDRPEESRFANYIASFIGLGMPSLRDRDAVPDMAKLYFSGRLACSQRNPEGLAAILSEYFGVPCEILSFVGHWITIPESDSCRLGDSPASGTLGVSAIIGSRVFQYQTKFRVRLGPMRLADLQRLLPGQLSWKQLQAWVANYIGHEFLWDAQYVLLADEVPQTQLGSGSMLGWTTWIITRKPGHDVDDVILDSDLY